MTFSRRSFLKGAGAAAGAAALVAGSARAAEHLAADHLAANHTRGHGGNVTRGAYQPDPLFHPTTYLSAFDRGRVVGTNERGGAIREYDIVAQDRTIEVAPGVFFAAWTFNGQVPGPTLRATEDDTLRIRFRNEGSHPHTMHFHGIHDDIMDGIPDVGPGQIPPGGSFTYEFFAEPHGVHLYHCHAVPLKRHIHKGLYGAYIVDPKDGWPGGEAENELVFMLNAFDTNFDGENEIYAVNTQAFAYVANPIRISAGKLQRAFVINITEFDPLNSFHLHGNFFHYTEIGHKENPRRFTDNVALIQGERGMLEFTYKRPGRFMFHAHQSELAELGWTGMFEVV